MSVTRMSDYRDPTVYTVTVSHSWDGEITVDIAGIGDDARSRSLAAETLLQAASCVDGSISKVEF